MEIIDVSQHNGKIDWKQVRTEGVIIRVGYRGYTQGGLIEDSRWKENAKGAVSQGIPKGYYFVTQAVNESEATAEADYCIELFKDSDLEPELPIFFDSEYSSDKPIRDGRADFISKEKRTRCAIAFCERVLQHGYKVGVYANTDWFKNQLEVALLLDYYIWCAQYATKCTAKHRVDIWQYTSKGDLRGLKGNVDFNKVYVNLGQTEERKKPINNYVIGTYELLHNMNVREEANIDSRIKKKNELTKNGQEKSNQNGILLAGTRVSVSEFIHKNDYVWAKIPSGYVAFKDEARQKYFMQKV